MLQVFQTSDVKPAQISVTTNVSLNTPGHLLLCRCVLCNEYTRTPRALCRIKLLPVTHVLVDTWMLTVKSVYKLLNVSGDLKWTTNTRVTPFSLTFKA